MSEKWWKVAILLQMMLVFAAAQNTPGVNLMNNGGFESGTDWWGFADTLGDSGAATIEYSHAEAAHSGSSGAKVMVTQRSPENWHIQLQPPTNWTSALGLTYRLTFWARVDSDSTSKYIHVAVQDGPPDFEYRAGTDFYLDTAWQQYSMEWLSDVEGAGALRFNVYLGSYPGTYYFDDFEVIELEPVSILPKQSPFSEPYFSSTLPSWDILGRTNTTRPFMKGIRIQRVK